MGDVFVTIPKAHHMGEDKPSRWRRLLDAEGTLALTRISPQGAEEFWGEMGGAAAKTGDRQPSVLVYIHGFNVSFEEAAIRAAQIGADLKVDVPVFFSWPSGAQLLDYGRDAVSVGPANRHWRASWKDSGAQDLQTGQLHLLAHSMGSRCTLRSLNSLAGGRSENDSARCFLPLRTWIRWSSVSRRERARRFASGPHCISRRDPRTGGNRSAAPVETRPDLLRR